VVRLSIILFRELQRRKSNLQESTTYAVEGSHAFYVHPAKKLRYSMVSWRLILEASWPM